MTKAEVFELVKKYNRGKCTSEEKDLLESWYVNSGKLYQLDLPEAEIATAVDDIYKFLPKPLEKRPMQWTRLVAAACVVIVAGLCIYFYQRQNNSMAGKVEVIGADIAPGKNLAMLQLDNGQLLPLSHTQKGIKVNNGGLVYPDGSGVKKVPKNYWIKKKKQTIIVPRGGQYTIELPDGTKVWLNSASSLGYSTDLGKHDKTRNVQLKGEAYFEVAKNKKRPFVVETLWPDGQIKQTVEVLGTHFNIYSYADEPDVKTTLIEGVVKVRNIQSAKSIKLSPGQQSILSQDGGLDIKETNIDEADWKDGKFSFNNASLQEVLRELTRWYNVKVYYENAIPDRHFSGHIDRSLMLSEALEILAKLGIHFSIAKQTIIVHH